MVRRRHGAFHEQASAKNAIALGRFEWFDDANGVQKQHRSDGQHTLYEGTFTYEYKWVEGLLTLPELEYRFDESSRPERTSTSWPIKTRTSSRRSLVAFIAFFEPHR